MKILLDRTRENRENNLVHFRVICQPENAADEKEAGVFNFINNFYTTMTSEGLVSLYSSQC